MKRLVYGSPWLSEGLCMEQTVDGGNSRTYVKRGQQDGGPLNRKNTLKGCFGYGFR